jgi:hypothetical protein
MPTSALGRSFVSSSCHFYCCFCCLNDAQSCSRKSCAGTMATGGYVRPLKTPPTQKEQPMHLPREMRQLVAAWLGGTCSDTATLRMVCRSWQCRVPPCAHDTVGRAVFCSRHGFAGWATRLAAISRCPDMSSRVQMACLR